MEKPKPQKLKREKVKADPALVAKARELRDRYLEHVNSGQLVLESSGRYDVARALPPTVIAPAELKQLPDAARAA